MSQRATPPISMQPMFPLGERKESRCTGAACVAVVVAVALVVAAEETRGGEPSVTVVVPPPPQPASASSAAEAAETIALRSIAAHLTRPARRTARGAMVSAA